MKKKYEQIVKERDLRLKKCNNDPNTYDFAVAHGLTDALRIIDGVGIFRSAQDIDVANKVDK